MTLDTEQYARYLEIGVQYAMEYGLNIVGALLIFLVGKWVAKRLQRFAGMIMERAEVDPTLRTFGTNLIYVVLMIVVILAALNTLGVHTTSFVAILGAAGLAIGLALQGTLGNVGSGVLLILFKPFEVGNFVTVAGESGTVQAISLFATTLTTPDNKVIIIPNASITSSTIINFSAQETRRVDLTFGISYEDDLRIAKGLLEEIVAADERVLDDPAPFVAVSELADSSVNFVVRVWVKSADYWPVHFDTIEKVKLAFDANGISIPFPQVDMNVRNMDQLTDKE